MGPRVAPGEAGANGGGSGCGLAQYMISGSVRRAGELGEGRGVGAGRRSRPKPTVRDRLTLLHSVRRIAHDPHYSPDWMHSQGASGGNLSRYAACAAATVRAASLVSLVVIVVS